MEIKKLSFRFVMACCVMLLMGVSEAKAKTYFVSTAEEFIEHWKANDNICIVADIDLSGFKEGDRCEKYTGTLSSLRLDKCSNYALMNIPEMLAVEMEGAYIHDIEIKDSKPDWDESLIDTNEGTAVLARDATKCRMERIILTNITIDGDDVLGAASYGACLFCHAYDSTFEEIEAYKCRIYTNSCYAGVFCGETIGSNFKKVVAHVGCAVFARGSIDNAYSGGLVGYAENSSFYDCHNLAQVAGNADCIGGIAGKSDGTTFELCNNYGSVSHKAIDGFEAFENSSKLSALSAPTLGSDEIDRLIGKGLSQEFSEMYQSSVSVLLGGVDMTHPVMTPNEVYEAKITEYMNDPLFSHEQYINEIREALGENLWETLPDMMTPREYAEKNLELYDDISSPADIEPGEMSNSAYWRGIGTVLAIVIEAYEVAKAIYKLQDHDNVGGIVGLMKGGSTKRCTNYGYIYSADAFAGGIVGQACDDNPSIVNCMNQGCVKGYEQTGGIVGQIQGGTLKTNINVGNVSSGNSTSDTFGCIYGEYEDGTKISHNLYVSNRNTTIYNPPCAEVTLKMLATGEAGVLLNKYAGENVWRQTLGVDYYPALGHASDSLITADQSIDPTIHTKHASNFVKALANQYSDIVLEDDIDLNSSLANFSSRLMPFYGSIDGQGHRLKNMYFVCDQVWRGHGANDNENTNVGLLSYARNATFKNLELCNFNVLVAQNTDTCAVFVGNSANCTYENIHITGSSTITPHAVNRRVGGLVGYSQNDSFTDCTTGPLCHFEGKCSYIADEIVVGGLVGESIGSSFTSCINKAEVVNDNDCTGGIVAKIENGKIERCLNMGFIRGAEYLGGIVGLAEDTEIHRCANTGLVRCTATFQESEVGGIVGRFAKDDANKALYECANWGNVYRSAGENQGAIYGDTSGSPSVHDNYYSFVTEDGDYPEGSFGREYVLSGEWTATYNADYDKHQGYYYQDIDRNSFGTHYPVPVAAAGEITKNWDCKSQKFSYSNLYNAGVDHTTDANKFGICQTCGSVCDVPAYYVDIDNSQDMVELARALSRGQSFSNNEIKLTSDIDFQDNTTPFLGIGTTEHPYTGVFEGNYHTIKNLVMEPVSTVPGLFSTVTGTTTISNIIMDKTCVLRSSGWGAGGIVGCSRGSTTLNLTNCGFEGFVSGYKNVGAILGGTFSVEGATINVTIDHCYNTGTVKGDTESASLCGYAGGATGILYSWNAGNVTGYSEDAPIIRGNYNMRCCYDINASNDDNHITAEDVTSGQLAFYLNESISGWGSESAHEGAWYQQVGVEEHPSFIRNGDHVVYHHHYRWCDERETIIDYYDNEIIPFEESAIIKHDFDENGICLRKAGEVHGEECPHNYDWWSVTKMGHLYYIAEQVRIGEEQHNIDMQADLADNYFVFKNGALSADTEGFRQWIPIGTDEFPFKKKFVGNNHVVSGLYMDPTEQASVAGLFGVVQGNASISNVGVTESYFGNAAYGGSIAAVAIADEENIANEEFPHISNCYASYGVIDKVTEGGGILGRYFVKGDALSNFTPPICDCYNTSMVTPEKNMFAQYVGGILGTTNISTNPTMTTRCYYLEGCTTGTSGYGEAKPELTFRLGEVSQLLDHGQGVWAQPIDKFSRPTFGTEGVTYSRSVKPGNWASLVLPFPVTSDENVQFYTFTKLFGSDTKAELHLEKIDAVPANTPCFFKTSEDCSMVSLAAAGNNVETPSSSEVRKELGTQDEASICLIGSYYDITVSPPDDDDFILNYYLAQNKLWWGEEAFNLPAFRAYIDTNYWPIFA